MIPITGANKHRLKMCLPVAVLALLFCLLAEPATARLGESYSECDVRYGKPNSIRSEHGAQVRRSHKRGVEVAIRF